MGLNWTCCWPGLAAAWHRGQLAALMAALLYSWLICLVLLASFVWPQWFDPWLLRLFWLVLVGVWAISTVYSHLSLSTLVGRTDSNGDARFQQAQQEYLQGNWFEAESILLDLLEKFPRDAEALLLLVGVLRHTQRWQPALRRLDQLEALDGSVLWRFEIVRERQMLEQRFAQALAT